MRHAPYALFAAIVALSVSLACTPKPGTAPGPTAPGGVISCGTKAVTDHAAQTLAPVNQCLASTGDVTNCLLGLVQPLVGITTEVIACVTRHEGSAAAAASRANPDDAVDARRMARAREFLEGQGFQFAD